MGEDGNFDLLDYPQDISSEGANPFTSEWQFFFLALNEARVPFFLPGLDCISDIPGDLISNTIKISSEVTFQFYYY